MFARFFTRYGQLVNRRPYVIGAATGVSLASSADILAQNLGDSPVDYTRTLSLSIFGFAYSGLAQTFIYGKVYPYLFQQAVVRTVAFDQLALVPFLYFPIFNLCCLPQGLVRSEHSWEEASRLSLQSWYEDLQDAFEGKGPLPLCLAVWVPAQLINFKFVPRNRQVGFICSIGFVWTVVLSYITNQKCEATWLGIDESKHLSHPAPSELKEES